VWEKVAVNISSQFANILNAAPAIIMAFKTKAGTSPTTPTQGAPSMGPMAPFDPYQMNSATMRNFTQASAPAAGPNAERRTDPASGATGTPPAPGPGTASAADEALAQIVGLVNQALNCLNRQIDGRQAAAAICDLNGELAYDALVQQINLAGIPTAIELAKGIPELKSQVVTYEAQLRQFIEEFVEGPYGENEDPGEESVSREGATA
jgi:hypothetical protein